MGRCWRSDPSGVELLARPGSRSRNRAHWRPSSCLFDLGPEAGPLAEPPFGTNMAFPKRVFEKYGSFRTDLGPRPGSEIRGEDTEFGRRLLTRRERLRYEPSAVVHHQVAKNRLQKRSLWLGGLTKPARYFANSGSLRTRGFTSQGFQFI